MTVLVEQLQGMLEGVLVDAVDVFMELGLGVGEIRFGIGSLGGRHRNGRRGRQRQEEQTDELVHGERKRGGGVGVG